jgi:hypothetical protein
VHVHSGLAHLALEDARFHLAFTVQYSVKDIAATAIPYFPKRLSRSKTYFGRFVIQGFLEFGNRGSRLNFAKRSSRENANRLIFVSQRV